MQEILKWLTCWTSSVLTQTVRKIPTICLQAIRLYFIWLVLEANSKPLGTSSSSEGYSSSLVFNCWPGRQKSLLSFLFNSGMQLQLFNLLPLSVMNIWLNFLREGFMKPPRETVGFNPLCATSDDLFSAWLTFNSHFAAGSLSSTTSTFPAFKGTISWKLIILKTITRQERTVCLLELLNSYLTNKKIPQI